MAAGGVILTDAVPNEHFEQRELVKWFRQTFKGVRIFAIPNGGIRSLSTAAKLKAEGVSSGVPDLCVPEWRLWIEMKRVKGGSLSAEQLLQLQDYVDHERKELSQRSEIQNIIDEISDLIDSTLYKLRFLK